MERQYKYNIFAFIYVETKYHPKTFLGGMYDDVSYSESRYETIYDKKIIAENITWEDALKIKAEEEPKLRSIYKEYIHISKIKTVSKLCELPNNKTALIKMFYELTAYEAFTKIMSGTEILPMHHWLYFANNREYIGDIDTKLNTMYFSHTKVWNVFREEYEMTHEEVILFLHDQMMDYGYNIKPY